MSKTFYRLQMKDGSNGETVTNHMLSIDRITAHEDFGGEEFVSLKPGDIVIVHRSAYPEAMVEVINKIPSNLLDDKSLGVDFSVHVLSWFEDIRKVNSEIDTLWGNFPFTKTFSSLNSGNPTYSKVSKWYNLIISKRMLDETISLLNFKKQIILQGPPGTGKTYTAKNIAEQIIFGEISKDKKIQKAKLEKSEQFRIIQFHPAFSYEDFVRGISAKATGEKVAYEVENRILASYAKVAQKNWENTHSLPDENARRQQIMHWIEQWQAVLEDKLSKGEVLTLTEGTRITRTTTDGIRYDGLNLWKVDGGVPNRDLVEMYLHRVSSREDIKGLTTLTSSANDKMF